LIEYFERDKGDFLEASKRFVAILLYEGVYLLDFCGPQEIFFDTILDNGAKAFEVALVAPSNAPIKAHTGSTITPDFSIINCPAPDILVIPGGNLELTESNTALGQWIRETSEKSTITLSVCTGAFILASLGILDGLKACTWFGATGYLQKKYPQIKVCPNERITDNGKIVTTAGVSAGIDGALYVVSKLINRETAKKTANYIEYNWI
jgi:transcriptional regulator GlxA family with amidase domain